MLYNIISPKARKRVYKALAVIVPVVTVLAGAGWGEMVVAVAAACGFAMANGNVSDY